MKKNKFLILLSSVSLLLNSCDNPLEKYADDYVNVVWTSTSASSLDITMYVLEENIKNNSYSLCIVRKNGKVYYYCGYSDDSFTIDQVNEYGKAFGYINTSVTYLKNEVYCSDICSIQTSTFNQDIGNPLNVKQGDYIELEMKQFNPKEEATPLMFSNVKYTSSKYNFITYSKVRNIKDCYNDEGIKVLDENTFFVSYGTMNINNTYIDVALKFLPDNKFFIFRNDDIEDIIYSGTYTNS